MGKIEREFKRESELDPVVKEFGGRKNDNCNLMYLEAVKKTNAYIKVLNRTGLRYTVVGWSIKLKRVVRELYAAPD